MEELIMVSKINLLANNTGREKNNEIWSSNKEVIHFEIRSPQTTR